MSPQISFVLEESTTADSLRIYIFKHKPLDSGCVVQEKILHRDKFICMFFAFMSTSETALSDFALLFSSTVRNKVSLSPLLTTALLNLANLEPCPLSVDDTA